MLGENIETNSYVENAKRRNLSRDAKQERIRERMSCSASDGFVYDHSLRPAELMYRLLVPPPAADGSTKNMHGSAKIGETSHTFQRLRMWVPDTIVTEPTGKLVWYYSNAKGFVCSTSSFTPDNIFSKLGSVCRHPDEVIVVSKVACWERIPPAELRAQQPGSPLHTEALPSGWSEASDSGSRSDTTPPFIGFHGNDSCLLTARQLRDHCDKLEEESHGGAADWGISGRAKCVQRYIKPKGTHAFMVRTRLTSDDPVATGVRRIPATYVVTNAAPMAGRQKPTLFVQYTGPKTGAAHESHRSVAQRATLVDTAEGGGTVALAREVWRYLEYRLRHGLDELVVDFVKDDLGTWWMTQIKGFKFRRVSVLRPLKVGSPAGGDRSPAGQESPSFSKEQPLGLYEGSKSQTQLFSNQLYLSSDGPGQMAAEQGAGKDVSDAVLLRSIAHSKRCSLCCALYAEKELRYRLTRRAARTFILHLRARLFDDAGLQDGSLDHQNGARASWKESKARRNDLWPSSLSLFWEETLIEEKRSARRMARSSGSVSRGNGAASTDKKELVLCDSCFQLYEKEEQLMKVEKELLKALGLGEEESSRRGFDADAERHKTRFQIEMEMRFGATVAAAIARKAPNHCIPIYHASVAGRGEPLTVCRILVAVHELLDMPLSFFSRYKRLRRNQNGTQRVDGGAQTKTDNGDDDGVNDNADERTACIWVSFDLLGSKYRFEVPLPAINVLQKTSASPSKDDSQPQNDDESTKLSVPIESLKVLHFVSPGTRVHERPFEAYERVGSHATCGLTRFLKEKGHLYFDFGLVNRKASVERSREADFDDELYGYDGHRKERPDPSEASGGRESFDNEIPIGRACVSIGQFQSSYINYSEMVVPVVWEDFEAHQQFEERKVESMPHLRVSVGVQRILEDVPVWSLPEPLLKYCGLYVAPIDGALSSSSALPPEWVALTPTRHQTAIEIYTASNKQR